MYKLEELIRDSLAKGKDTEWIESLVRNHADAFDAILHNMTDQFAARERENQESTRSYSSLETGIKDACRSAVGKVMGRSEEMAWHIRHILSEMVLHLPADASEYGFFSMENLAEALTIPALSRAAETGFLAPWMKISLRSDVTSSSGTTGTEILFRLFGVVPDADQAPWWYYSRGIGDVLAEALTKTPKDDELWTARCGRAEWAKAGRELRKLGILPSADWGSQSPPAGDKGEPALSKVTAKLLANLVKEGDREGNSQEIADLLGLDLAGAAACAKVEWLRLPVFEWTPVGRYGSREAPPVQGFGDETFTVAHALAALGHAPAALVPSLDTPAAGAFRLTIKLCGIVGGAYRPTIEDIPHLIQGTDTDHVLLRYALQTDPEHPGLPVAASTNPREKSRSLDFDEWRGIANRPLFRQLLDRPEILKTRLPVHPHCRLSMPDTCITVAESLLLQMAKEPSLERQRELVREVLSHPGCWAVPARIPRTSTGWKKGFCGSDSWDNGAMPFPIAVLATIELHRGAREKIWEQADTRPEEFLMAGLSTGNPVEIVQNITSQCTQGRTNLRNMGLNADALKAAARLARAHQALQNTSEASPDEWPEPCL
jgi:hypothetical protein